MRKQTPIESGVHTLVLNVKLGTPPPVPWLPVPDAFYHTALQLQLPQCKFIFHASESYSSLANPGIARFSAYWGSTRKRAAWRLTDTAGNLRLLESTALPDMEAPGPHCRSMGPVWRQLSVCQEKPEISVCIWNASGRAGHRQCVCRWTFASFLPNCDFHVSAYFSSPKQQQQ